jgi:hypothetical protein
MYAVSEFIRGTLTGRVFLPLFFLALLFCFPHPAYATSCASPAGVEGQIMYNSTYNVMQYCNNLGAWIAMGSKAAGAGGAGCSSPSAVKGQMVYNQSFHVLQWCDGTNWHAATDTATTYNNGLVGWWKLIDGSGTSAKDSSGNGYTGTLTAAPSWVTTGPNGGGLAFNGSSQFVNIATSLNLATWTVSAWVNLSALPTSGHTAHFIDELDASNDTNYAIGVDNNDYCGGLDWIVYFTDASGDTEGTCYQPASIATGTWYLVTATYTTTGLVSSLYLDGVLVASNGNTNAPAHDAGYSMTIGARQGNGYATNFYTQGTIDDVRLWNRALLPTEVSALYNAEAPPTGTAISWLQHTANTTFTATYPSTTTAGSLLLVCAQFGLVTATNPVASDTAGNAWTVAVNTAYNPATVGTDVCWYAINKAATASDVVTISATGEGSTPSINISEWDGISASNPVDVTNIATGSSSVPNSGSANATTNANDLIIGYSGVNSGDSVGACCTQIDEQNGNEEEYEIVSTTGSYAANFTNSNTKWIAQMIAFKGAPANPCGNPTLSGPVGWWMLKDGSGTSAADASGYGNIGTLQNSPTWVTTGRNGGGLTLNGTSQYVDAGNASGLNFERTQPFSVTAWVYVLPGSPEYEAILSKRNAVNPFQGFVLSDNTGANQLVAVLYGTDSGQIQLYSPSNSLSPSAWHHVAMTYNGSSVATGVELYIDGVNQTLSVSYNGLDASMLNSSDMKIGTDVTSGGTDFGGTLDDVRVYNRALSANEVLSLYNIGIPDTSEGQLMYNATSHVPQFCDGTSWHATK